jgi:DNA-formamidopyrimidine glycosylase
LQERTGAKIPEGPELRHSRDVINSIIGGHWITDFTLGSTSRFAKNPPESYSHFRGSLPARVLSIDTKGKFMWWTLETRDGVVWYMWCTYGMSGQWTRVSTKHTAASVRFMRADSSIGDLHFNDPRHFGTLKFVRSEEAHVKKLASLGPDVLESPVSADLFAENILKKPARTIAEALMDQKTISGVGNYLKSEALFRSGISPWRLVVDITPNEYVKLSRDVQDVCKESYASQGASIRTYKTVDGRNGTTQFNFRVYSRKLCPKGHSVTSEETPEGRTSWWCKICQT